MRMDMKTRLLTLASLILLFSGCMKDDRLNFMVDDSFGFTARQAVVEASIHTGSCSVGIAKNGIGSSAASVEIISGADDDKAALDAYNKANGTSFKALPAYLYEFSDSKLEYSEKEVVKEVSISWDAKLVSQMMESGDDFVIPLCITSGKLNVNKNHRFLMVHLNRSTLAVEQTRQVRSIEGKAVEADESGKVPELKETITLDLSLDHPIKNVGITLPVAVDNGLVAAFNDKEEDEWVAAPDGLVSIVNQSVSIPEGSSSATFQVVLDKGKLPFKDGKLQVFPNYVVPVAVNADVIKATMSGEEFDLKGLGLGNTVTYICVSYAMNGISVVVREWGRYSKGTAWYSDLDGFSSGADRTIAMDDNYVYIAHSSGTAGLYALNRSNGSFAKKLDVSPTEGGKCTHPVSCVRMIRNESGADILLFSSLKVEGDEHVYVYAYVNGTDAAPVRILDFLHDNKGGADDWRRYGDRFTVEGTWQNGKLWFLTWHDGTYGKMLGFHIVNGTVVNPEDPEDYYIPSDKAGIKDVVRYPGWDNFLVTRNGRGNIYSVGAPGANGWIGLDDQKEMPALSLAYGFNFFDFHGEDYIAFMQLDGENAVRGKLVIMDNKAESPAQFPDQLDWFAENRTPGEGEDLAEGLRYFPIQDPEDFEAKSSITASHSVGDCTVRYIGGSTYIAVLMQGCGLSLFQLQ